jgi:thiosulfate/3-mercaptopyruvate sulfurtransferase
VPRFFLIALLIFSRQTAFASDELVDSAWLRANRGATGIFLLDIQPSEQYIRSHIHGSINAPYVLWRTNKDSMAPGMLPTAEWLERFLGTLGISNNNTVVIIAASNQPIDIAAASRVFWTLKVMGHKNVAILNGGLSNYAYNYPGDIEAISRSGLASNYAGHSNTRLIANKNDILTALNNNVQLLDARTLGEYIGVITIKPNERPGTIPGSKNLPFDWLIDIRGQIRDKQSIITLFKAAGLDPTRDGTIHFCHTGNRAALTWFVDYAILGNRGAKLYDASMSEWAVRQELPMETRIELRPIQKRPARLSL